MNTEQHEHHICEIIRRVCERNNVGVTFTTELPEEGNTCTTVQAVYDLGRERRRVEARRMGLLAAVVVLHVAVCALSMKSVAPSWLPALTACAIGAAAYGVTCASRVPLVPQRLLDQEIALMLALHGHSIIHSGNRMEIHMHES